MGKALRRQFLHTSEYVLGLGETWVYVRCEGVGRFVD